MIKRPLTTLVTTMLTKIIGRTTDTSNLRAGEVRRDEPGLYTREGDTPTGGNIRWR